jgi:hypothetical protein
MNLKLSALEIPRHQQGKCYARFFPEVSVSKVAISEVSHPNIIAKNRVYVSR